MHVEVYPDRHADVAFPPDLTFECLADCSWCCHRGVPLFADEVPELVARSGRPEAVHEVSWGARTARERKDRACHTDIDGCACVFLDDDGRCSLQRETGWKPVTCRRFPLTVERADDGLRVTIDPLAARNCPGLGAGHERLADHLDAFLDESLWERDPPQVGPD